MEQNGLSAAVDQVLASKKSLIVDGDMVVIPPIPLRRLATLRAAAEGAAGAAQAAIAFANQRQELLQRALSEACEDQGLHIPTDEQRPVDLDWATGRVTFK